jgi:hypothetical protein
VLFVGDDWAKLGGGPAAVLERVGVVDAAG